MRIALATAAIAGGLSSVGWIQTAAAVPLPAGTTVSLPGTTVALRPALAGVVFEDELQPFSFADATGHTLSGVVQSRVVKSDLDGTFDFYWRITELSSEQAAGRGPGSLSSFRLGGFGAYSLDADWRIDGLGSVGPTSAVRFPDPGFINFDFANPELQAGKDSYFFILDSQATTYARVGLYDLVGTGGNGISGQFETFAPTAPVPEPAEWALMLVGFGLISRLAKAKRSPS